MEQTSVKYLRIHAHIKPRPPCALRHGASSSELSLIQQKYQKQAGQSAHVNNADSFAESRLLPQELSKSLLV